MRDFLIHKVKAESIVELKVDEEFNKLISSGYEVLFAEPIQHPDDIWFYAYMFRRKKVLTYVDLSIKILALIIIAYLAIISIN